ncbi:hypothetical protein ACSBR1_027538 [Camellia fascicularis]
MLILSNREVTPNDILTLSDIPLEHKKCVCGVTDSCDGNISDIHALPHRIE